MIREHQPVNLVALLLEGVAKKPVPKIKCNCMNRINVYTLYIQQKKKKKKKRKPAFLVIGGTSYR